MSATLDTEHFRQLIRASSYYNFVVTILVGVLLVFQVPLVILGLVSLGVLSSRTLRKQRRMGYLIAAYTIAWLAVFGYLGWIALRLRGARSELLSIEERLRERSSDRA